MIALIGGTGPEGIGLALRFAKAGERIVIGSRNEERGRAAAEKVRARLPQADIAGTTNDVAAANGDIIVITIPFDGQRDTLLALRDRIGDKVAIDAVVPLRFEKSAITASHVEEGSAAQQAQALLPQARVAAAFQNLSARRLADLDSPLDADVVVCSDHPDAKQAAMTLAAKIEGVRGLDGGPLANAHYVEEITALLLNLNRTYRTESSVRFTGI